MEMNGGLGEQGRGNDLARFGSALRRCAAQLRGTLAGNEDAFLDVGQSVVGFFEGTQSFSAMAAELAGSLMDGRFEALVGRLEDDAAHVADSCGLGDSEAEAAVLDRFSTLVAGTYAHADAFRRIVKQLQMLGISTRIESVRLGSGALGFQTLADDVEQLAGRIVTDFEAIKGGMQDLEATIARFRDDSRAASVLQDGCVSTISTALGRNVGALREVHEQARRSSGDLASQAEGIAADMSEVVASIQAHDIIRQQVEHVAEALEETVGELEGRDGEEELNRGMLLAWVADVGRLQAAQLGHSRERFHEAMEQVARSMESLAAAVSASVETVDRSFTGDGRDGARIVADVRAGTGVILDSLADFEKLSAGISARIASLAETVDGIFANLESIEEVGAEIELIALNASIKSARVGGEGRALSVLAESIQKLSVEARTHKERFLETTEGIREAGENLRGRADTLLDQERIRAFAARQEEILVELDAIYARMDADLDALRARGGDLFRSMTAFGGGLDIHERMCPLFAAEAETLDGVAGEAGALCADAGDVADRPERLERILSRYTMDSERAVHERMTGGGADAAETPGDDSWDNVELF